MADGGWRGRSERRRGGGGPGARLRRIAAQAEAVERDLRALHPAPGAGLAEDGPLARAAQARIEAALAAALVEARALARGADANCERTLSEGRADEDWRATASRDAPLVRPGADALEGEDADPWSEH